MEARRDISDQISMIGRQEKAYTECTEDAEFAEKRDGNTEIAERRTQRWEGEKRGGTGMSDRGSPPLAEKREGWGTLKNGGWAA